MGDALPPLVPKEVNLTDFQFMPLDVRRLRDSRITASTSGEEFRSAVLLWCAAWHQVPAASLPDDDVELAQLAGFGRILPAWREVRAGALHGWVKCSDGRLYHPVVAEKAIEAWNAKLFHQWRKECDRIRKENKVHETEGQDPKPMPPRPQGIGAGDGGIPTLTPASSAGTKEVSDGKSEDADGGPAENALKGQGQGQGDSVGSPKPDKPVRTRNAYPEDFERFWSGYPTDKLMSKQEAGKVWSKLTEDDRAAAMAALPGFVAHCRKDPTYRVIHACRFLSQRRFDGFAPQSKPPRSAAAPPDDDPFIDLRTGHRRKASYLRQAISRWRESPYSWIETELGPPPDARSCQVPTAILAEFGLAYHPEPAHG